MDLDFATEEGEEYNEWMRPFNIIDRKYKIGPQFMIPTITQILGRSKPVNLSMFSTHAVEARNDVRQKEFIRGFLYDIEPIKLKLIKFNESTIEDSCKLIAPFEGGLPRLNDYSIPNVGDLRSLSEWNNNPYHFVFVIPHQAETICYDINRIIQIVIVAAGGNLYDVPGNLYDIPSRGGYTVECIEPKYDVGESVVIKDNLDREGEVFTVQKVLISKRLATGS